ncbi:MAG: RidA family protein [Alphaproteobacteria bacterium]|nr:RidA family protein [Alphaproteobacteria bacterium]
MSILERLTALGITLPTPPVPVASYVPFVLEGSFLFVSGQIPSIDGKVQFTGKLGDGVSLETGQEASRLCAINLLAQAQAAVGLERVTRVVKLTGFVACMPNFTDHPKVINAASELMQAIFGDAGKHARAAVGAPSLPLDASVEIEAIFAVQ